MSTKRTIKALEELVKTENMAVAALDAALDETDDNKVRRNYRKWRDAHARQADALNNRLEDLGGEPVQYEVGTGKGQATLWGKLSGVREDTSIVGMRIGAERGLKRYIDHLDEIDDPKALSIIRKNLEAKQDEIEWYDEQASKDRSHKVDAKLEVSAEKAKEMADDGKAAKKGGLPVPLLVIAGALGAAAYFMMRRGEDADYEDFGEDAFKYEGEHDHSHSSDQQMSDSGSGNGMAGQYTGSGQSSDIAGMS